MYQIFLVLVVLYTIVFKLSRTGPLLNRQTVKKSLTVPTFVRPSSWRFPLGLLFSWEWRGLRTCRLLWCSWCQCQTRFACSRVVPAVVKIRQVGVWAFGWMLCWSLAQILRRYCRLCCPRYWELMFRVMNRVQLYQRNRYFPVFWVDFLQSLVGLWMLLLIWLLDALWGQLVWPTFLAALTLAHTNFKNVSALCGTFITNDSALCPTRTQLNLLSCSGGYDQLQILKITKLTATWDFFLYGGV